MKASKNYDEMKKKNSRIVYLSRIFNLTGQSPVWIHIVVRNRNPSSIFSWQTLAD